MSNHKKKVLLNKMTKRVSKTPQEENKLTTQELKDHYHLIRDDFLKLQQDLRKGYSLARGLFRPRGSRK